MTCNGRVKTCSVDLSDETLAYLKGVAKSLRTDCITCCQCFLVSCARSWKWKAEPMHLGKSRGFRFGQVFGFIEKSISTKIFG